MEVTSSQRSWAGIALRMAVLSRVKNKKQFYRPMNRVVQVHLKNIRPTEPRLDEPVFHCAAHDQTNHSNVCVNL